MNHKILTHLTLALSLILTGCAEANPTKKIDDNKSVNTETIANKSENISDKQKDVIDVQLSQSINTQKDNPKAKYQTCVEIDKQVANNLKTSFENSHYNISSTMENEVDDKKVDNANTEVKRLLTAYAKKADSMQCNFNQSKQQGLITLSSKDNKFRVYSWDIHTGGTMHNYAGFYQFVDDDNIHTQNMQARSTNDPLHQFPNAIFTANLDEEMGKHVYYLLVSTGVYSNIDTSQNLQILAIKDKKIIYPAIISASTLTSFLGFAYDFFSVVDRPERPIQLFKYDDKTKTIRFPVVVEDPKFPSGKVTDKKIEYRFDGQYFQRLKH